MKTKKVSLNKKELYILDKLMYECNNDLIDKYNFDIDIFIKLNNKLDNIYRKFV